MQRKQVGTGTRWESEVGYSRAVRVGDHVYVSGTTATNDDGDVVGIGDAGAQTTFILEKIGAALNEVGARFEHVVRTRMFVTDISQWEAIGAAHGNVFREIRPTATMVEIKALVDPEHLVEIEVDAHIHD